MTASGAPDANESTLIMYSPNVTGIPFWSLPFALEVTVSSGNRSSTQNRRLLIVFVALTIWSFKGAVSASGQFQNINTDTLRSSVVFIYQSCDPSDPQMKALCDPNTKEAPDGTGFIVSIPHKGGGEYNVLVTARHIADPRWAGCHSAPETLYIHFNKAKYNPDTDDLGYVDFSISASDANWKYPDDDSADVAVKGLDPDGIRRQNAQVVAISVRELPTEDEIKNVRIGDQVISPGLVVGASGAKRLYPISKFGYVSSIPGEKVSTRCCPDCEERLLNEWLIAANLVPGNSGAPILFVPLPVQYFTDVKNRRPLILGVQSLSMLGSDVAGMTPSKYLQQALQKLVLPDADLSITGESYKPNNPPTPQSPK